MNPFHFVSVTHEREAIADLRGDVEARYLAGGTTLLDLMRLGVEQPKKLVDIHRMSLNGVERKGRTLRIGAMVSNTNLAYHPVVQEEYPVLSQALLSGASPQLRNMATVGGNLMQRTRCPYFRDVSYACNKRSPGSGCDAIGGVNRMHALLGTSELCIATHPSDMSVALVALDAVVIVTSEHGERQIPIDSFFVPYGDDPARETTLMPGELIVAIELPAISYAKNGLYLKVRDRASYEFALASAAVMIDVAGPGQRINDVRIALGGVASKPWRCHEAEAFLRNNAAQTDVFEKAAIMVMSKARPQKDNAFKVELAQRTLVKALNAVSEMTQNG